MRESELHNLHTIAHSFKALCSEMEKPNMFIMPYDNSNPLNIDHFEKVLSCLREAFDADVFELESNECDLFSFSSTPKSQFFKCIAIDSGKIEKIRDVIKEVLWTAGKQSSKPPLLNKLLSAADDGLADNFKLSEYGIFIPYKTKKNSEIRTHSFNHKPVFYRYRISERKVNRLPANLKSFLQLLFADCPNHLFQKSNFRASARTIDEIDIKYEISHESSHELIELAKQSESFNQFKSRHENLQKFLLLNDPCTVACEVPLWLEEKEIQDYKMFFNTNDTLTGHIDVLRYEKDGKIGIWDYKPGAKSEVDASIQIWLYALMLSVRTGLSMKNIICGYFDEQDLFVLNPDEMIIYNKTE